MNISKKLYTTTITLVVSTILATATAQEPALYETHVLPETIVIEPIADQALMMDVDLIVKGPEGYYLRKSFPAGELVEFNPANLPENALPDGTYVYEVRVMGLPGAPKERGQSEAFEINTLMPNANGAFTIQNGAIIPPAIEQKNDKHAQRVTSSNAGTQGNNSQGTQAKYSQGTLDQVIADDLIVQSSACIGDDCANGESFGFDTLRLKENNTRLKFNDTSSSGSFPDNDWQLTANDSVDGGLNKFSIENTTGGRIPFTIEGPAPSNSLYVDDNGQVGFGTSTPVVEHHIVDGDSPTVRLEQDGSSGFAAQTWDIASNETNFFIRDVTNGSQLPFRIRPGAPTSAIDISGAGNVGIGESTPTAPLHVSRSDDTFEMLFLEQTNTGVVQDRNMMQLKNNGGIRFQFENTALGTSWRFQAATGSQDVFEIAKVGTGEIEMTVDANGNLTTAGVVNGGSSRKVKRQIVPVDDSMILTQISDLMVAEWTYKRDAEGIRHLGPMAEDFYRAFGLGVDEEHIAPHDLAGVALAAAKALENQNARQYEMLQEQQETLQEQQSLITAQERRIAGLESQNRMIQANLMELQELRAQVEKLKESWPTIQVALEP